MTIAARATQSLTTHMLRTLLVVAIVGLTLGMFLVLSQVGASVAANASVAVSSVANVVTIQTAGGSSGGGGYVFGPMMPASLVSTIASTPHITSTQRILLGPPLGVSISPASAPGGCNGGPPGSNGNLILAEDTTSPVQILVGSLGGASTLDIVQGRALGSQDENSQNAMVGEVYAQGNGVGLGSGVTVDGLSYNVVGIFAGSGCPGSVVVLPYPTATANSAAGGSTGPRIVYCYVDSYQNVGAVVASLQSKVGASYSAQSLANANHAALQSSVASIVNAMGGSELATLGIGAVVMMVVMVLMTSQRTRELGLLKALGFSDLAILGQISLESLLLALLGLPLALALAILGGPSIAQWAVSGVGSSNTQQALLASVQLGVSTGMLVLGAATTLGFGLLGAVYPGVRALRLKPTEALKHE